MLQWEKIGLLFDPSLYTEFKDFVGYAQSPQAIVLQDRIRVFFSIRKKDDSGKFISHIAFVDFDKRMKSVLGVSHGSVLGPGKLGTFDEHGIFPINPLKVGNQLVAYTCGWSRRVSVSVETAIGRVTSKDYGITFKRLGDGPIMSASLNEPFLVGDAFVQLYDQTFHMWYIYGTRWVNQPGAEPDRVYKIGHATSTDGVNFQREGWAIIPDKLNADECQALPTVIKLEGKWHMIFCYRHAVGFRKDPAKAYRLGYAYTEDCMHWTRNDDACGIKTSPGAWDSDMMCYPHLFECDGEVFLLYNGNEFGKHGFGLARLQQ